MPLSVLDLVPIPAGSTPGRALGCTLDLARAAERLGYHRFWLAEHHNMPGIASAATAVVIGHVAGGTSHASASARAGSCCRTTRRWSSPSSSARWQSLYPGRIDLGLGRAPGTDQRTARALRRDPGGGRRVPAGRAGAAWRYFAPAAAGPARAGGARRRAATCRCGSSARACSARSSPPRSGLPFAFASHFAPDAARCRRSTSTAARFRPSAQLDRPYAMLGVNVFAADTDAEARRLFTSLQQAFVEPAPRPPGPAAAADRRLRGATGRRRGARVRRADARRARSSARRTPSARGLEALRGARPAPTS